MKLYGFFATLILGTGASLVAAPAQAQDACPSFLCMAGMVQGKDNVPGCTTPVQTFFSPDLYIYDEEGIDWPATAINRGRFLSTCPGSNGQNSGILAEIIAEYGTSAG